MRRLAWVLSGLTATLGITPGTATGQVPEAAAGGGLIVQRYTFDAPEAAGIESFRLLTAPFTAAIALGSVAALEVAGAYAEGTATGSEGDRATLSGLTDTEITLVLGGDHLLLTAGASLPTGQTTQTLTEATVAGVVAAELLPFAVTSWGSGGGAGGDVAFAFRAGSVGIGLSGGYRVAREYEPLADATFAYRPGDQIRVRLAVDADVGEAGTLSLLVGLQRFGDDEAAGSNLFRSGDRLEGVLTYAFAVGRTGSALLWGGAYHRENGSVLLQDPTLAGATDSPSQQLFLGGFNARFPWGRVTLLPDAEARVFRSQDGVGQGWDGSAGAALDLRLAGRRFGRRLILAPSGRVRYGNVTVREGAESGLTGWEAGLTLRVEGGR